MKARLIIEIRFDCKKKFYELSGGTLKKGAARKWFWKKSRKFKKVLDKQKNVWYYTWDKEAEQSHQALIET